MPQALKYATLQEIGMVRQSAQAILARCLKDFEAMPKCQNIKPENRIARLQLQIAQAVLGKRIAYKALTPVDTTKEVNQHNSEKIAHLESLLLHINSL